MKSRPNPAQRPHSGAAPRRRRWGRLSAAAALGGILAALTVPTAAAANWARDEQWQLRSLHADRAWKQSSGAGVTVAVLDSGVDSTHPDLVGQVLPGLDLVDRGGDGHHDAVGHGTTVAGLIAGRNDDRDGVVGLAPHAKILPIRVLDTHNRYEDPAVVAEGVRWAVDKGARVINLSLGGSWASDQLLSALRYAFAHDVVVIACTGNVSPDAPSEVWYPARQSGVVAVSGLAEDAKPWSGSLFGPSTVLSGPATNLLGARPGGYWRVQGTSFAAPLVSGTAALIRARWPRLSAANVINRLVRTATDLGVPGRDSTYGFGALNPAAALTANVPLVVSNPLDPSLPHTVPAPAPPSGPSAKAPSGSTPSVADKMTRHLMWIIMGGLVAIMIIVLAATLLSRRRPTPTLGHVPCSRYRGPSGRGLSRPTGGAPPSRGSRIIARGSAPVPPQPTRSSKLPASH